MYSKCFINKYIYKKEKIIIIIMIKIIIKLKKKNRKRKKRKIEIKEIDKYFFKQIMNIYIYIFKFNKN